MRKVKVVRHAVDQLVARKQAEETREELEDFIISEVRLGIDAGRMDKLKPHVFRLYAEKGKGRMSHDRDRCVWNADRTLAWIVRRHDAYDVVMTTLTRTKTPKGVKV